MSAALLSNLQESYPELAFTASNSFYWSPKHQTIYYQEDRLLGNDGVYKLLHETGHGLLAHNSYETDFELLQLELAAWQKAKEIAADFSITIDTNHIEDCLDSYRDWLHARSLCPVCQTNGLQTNKTTYECLNCSHSWQVSRSRFCRAYRRSKSVVA